MSDPIEELQHARPKQTRAQKWADKGIPTDTAGATRRVLASRKSRIPAKTKAHLGYEASGGFAKAVEAISDRFDVSRAQVLKRFIEDGIREYGNASERKLAGLDAPKKQNPFDEMSAPKTPAADYDMSAGGTYAPVDMDTVSAITGLKPFKTNIPGISAGQPLPADYQNSYSYEAREEDVE